MEKKTAAVQSVAGALFFLLINQSFSGTFGIIFLFPTERGIVFKERASRSYHVGAYFWSKSMAELPRTYVKDGGVGAGDEGNKEYGDGTRGSQNC